MKKLIFLIFACVAHATYGQTLRDINYNYLYHPEAKISFHLKPVRQGDSWKILYGMKLRDTTQRIEDYAIQWESREAISDKGGSSFSPEDNQSSKTRTEHNGILSFSVSQAPKIVAAKVIDLQTKTAWMFYTHLEPNYPVNNYLIEDQEMVYRPVVNTSDRISLGEPSDSWLISYYNDIFPAAAPAFSEGQAKVSKGMKVDSVFSVQGESTIFSMKGLYLIQRDTLSQEGLAFRAEDDYPRYSKVQNLAGPLIYICTKQEYDRLELAKGDKKTFDRIVLGITSDTERAKKLIRNYFRRVELANHYFTSYKEGWKTDRGMIYIVFGVPDEVFRFNDREVWSYDNASFKVSFSFTKSPSIFDPDNYVLIREKKYQDTWYEVIDLWRNARF